MALQVSLFDSMPENLPESQFGERQGRLIRKVSRYSTGRPKNERLKEILAQLEKFQFSDSELDIFDAEISAHAKHYGHEGHYPLGSNRKGRGA